MKTKNHTPLSQLFSQSLILSAFSRLASRLYKGVRESAAGRFFRGYNTGEDALHEGIVGSLCGQMQAGAHFLRPLRFRIAGQFDTSCILGMLQAYLRRLAGLSLNTYGLVFLFFSLFSTIVYAMKTLAPSGTAFAESASYADLILSAACLLIGICLVASHGYLHTALRQSRIAGFLLFRAAGASEEYFRSVPPTEGKMLISSVIGSLLGLCTAVIPPVWIALGFAGLLIAFTVYKIPECGVVLAFFSAPFLPTMLLVGQMLYLLFCFLVKYLRGKRSLHFGWLDLCVLLFMTVTFFAGISSASPGDSILPTAVYLCFMTGYFLVVNLIRSSAWVQRCIWAVLTSSSLVALYGIYQNFFTVADTTWQDTEMFSEISGRVVSTLENPNVLAEYLIMCLMLPAALFFLSETMSGKLSALFFAGVIGSCLIFTWSRGAWLGFMIAFLLFLFLYTKKTLVVCLIGVFGIPFLPFVLPQSILNRFLSIGNLGDTSTSYRVHIWEGVIAMIKDHFFAGIGVGSGVFGKVYPRYSLSGIETAPHSHNLYLQILVESGFFGLLLFVIFLFAYVRFSFTVYTKPLAKKPRVLMAAVFCGVLAVLAQGMTDYIWYNYRVFLFFWLMIGLTAAIGRTAEAENRDPEELLRQTQQHMMQRQ